MARKMFTQEQVRIMAENPYTLHVSTTQITFTNAFKEEFWQGYQEGDTPRTIMYDLGYDPEVLGRNRLSGIQNVVCKQAVSAKGFHERPQRKRQDTSAEGDSTTQAQLRQMQHRLKYLEQEVEFLKKYPQPEIHASEGRSHE
ncbi:HTH domain-containing protein [Evtepia gabavorous]|uniref:HTH domain-containing protein n=1 Tax=Evtepia gabavorous TaxID=2211183 RepID=UPI003A90B357